ncbi:MAG: BrnT family toxin [Spirochaetota bacterium]
MKFEWDSNKARSNLKKHEVSFEEPVTALNDPMSATGFDPDHSLTEKRYITFGLSKQGRLLVVAHTDDGEIIRIISARPATRGERKIYEEN